MWVDQHIVEAERAFLNAPFRADGWLAAVRQIARATGSARAQLIGIGGPRTLPFNILSELPSDPHGHLGNPALHGSSNWRVGSTFAAGTIRHEAHYAAYRSRHDTSDYDDACSDLDGLFGCQMALLFEPGCLIGLALMRSRRDGPCDQPAIHAFDRIARQARRALRVQLALGQQSAELMLGGLAQCPEATLLLDGFGQLAAMTRSAERLFDHPCGLRLDGLRIGLADPAEQRSLEGALARLYASDGIAGAILHETRVGRCSACPEGRWRLFAVRLPPIAHGFGFEPQLALTLKPLPAA